MWQNSSFSRIFAKSILPADSTTNSETMNPEIFIKIYNKKNFWNWLLDPVNRN